MDGNYIVETKFEHTKRLFRSLQSTLPPPPPPPRKGKEINDKKTENGGQIAAELNKT
jgi:hypothetical protein